MKQTEVERLYKEKEKSIAEVAAMVCEASDVWVDIALSHPREVMREMTVQAKPEHKTNLHMMLDIYPVPWYENEVSGIHGISWFSGGQARKAIAAGIADAMPCYYRDIPGLIKERDIECLCVTVSEMDEHGYFSMGPTSGAAMDLVFRAKHIYLEVNKQMPRCVSAPMIHISQVTAFCRTDYELPVTGSSQIDAVSEKIGGYIAEEIPDGAAIQLGIGAIPDAVGMALKKKHHLGIHTEMFTDSMVELIECGAVDNSCKEIHRGRSVTTFAFGSKRIYDYVDNNPAIEILPVDYVNEPSVIAQLSNFISVNAAVEVDLWGQVCAESLGTRHLSGTGGQVDYVRGAVLSQGGKSFIAFPSTAKGGTVSRIRSCLSEGAVVTTGKNDVDYIVTEYGLAKLRGKTLQERTKELIRIAHPNFRDELTHEAKQRGILI